MNIIKNIINFIKKIFNKPEEIKKIEEAKIDKKEEFIQNIKIVPKEEKKKIETLVCEGDGLGIQKKISC